MASAQNERHAKRLAIREARRAKRRIENPHAKLRYLRVTPRKARIIANMIRGKRVTAVVHDLRFLHKAGAREMFKLLVSAIANAEHKNPNVDVDALIVAKVTVDEGPTLRRWRPRAQGRATRVEKKTSHIYLELATAGAEN